MENEDILETARAISGNDPEVVKAVEFALGDPKSYLKQNADRFDERGIELDDEDTLDGLDSDELLFLAMVDELEEHGYAFEFDWKCELEDFLWGLEQIKGYSLISDVLKKVKLSEEDDIKAWGKQINAALGGKACVCRIAIDSDSYPLTIATAKAFENITAPAVMQM